ncbi:MAG: T9SS type A sorting domain-containing protein, partial [Bacteroidales bacterium]|nr:T9SS type A sorting domain-containing protein [Bacteroidales bacterium]
LNVNPVYNTDLFASICEGEVYNENGFNVNEAGVYSQTLQAVNGCDSVVNLTLSVNPIFNTNLSAFICEGETYAENGFNVSEAGVYTQNLQTVNGCDSIVTLTLNVNPIFNTELSATICEGSVYTENGFNVSEAGVYTQTLQTINGCDSIVTLTLTVLPSYNINLTATICQGSELNISGFNVTEGGVYTQNLTSINGCDSIVTLTVTELPTVHTDLTLTICEGTSLNFSGFNVSEAGIYTQTHTSVNGCDSIVTLTLNVNPTFDTTINATINAGETYAEFGFNETEAGTYVQNLQTVNGCDSTITLILDVNSSLMDVEHSELSFYPNPTNSKITFSSTIESIEVIDLTGRCVLTFSNAREINIESLPAGAYYLRLTNNDKAIMRKVIKE